MSASRQNMIFLIQVEMDSGGAIRTAQSEDTLETGYFGGCSAIYANTAEGIYALYHLRSVEDLQPEMIMTAKDSNEPYREWLQKLKKEAGENKIYFYIGTPHSYCDDDLESNHPRIGMQRYLLKLCKMFGIVNYDITLLNMKGVNKISVTKNGITYFNFAGEIINVEKAQYQTDKLILDNTGWPSQKCLNYIDPNMDFDNELREKYTLLNDLEEMEKKLAQIANTAGKGDHEAFLTYTFIKELLKVAKSKDLNKLISMKSIPYYQEIIADKIKSGKNNLRLFAIDFIYKKYINDNTYNHGCADLFKRAEAYLQKSLDEKNEIPTIDSSATSRISTTSHS